MSGSSTRRGKPSSPRSSEGTRPGSRSTEIDYSLPRSRRTILERTDNAAFGRMGFQSSSSWQPEKAHHLDVGRRPNPRTHDDSAMKPNIEVFSDVICPWCYIGKRRL